MFFVFVSKSEICNFANGNAWHSCGQVLEKMLCNLKYDLHDILKWFQLNSLKPNPGKF